MLLSLKFSSWSVGNPQAKCVIKVEKEDLEGKTNCLNACYDGISGINIEKIVTNRIDGLLIIKLVKSNNYEISN